MKTFLKALFLMILSLSFAGKALAGTPMLSSAKVTSPYAVTLVFSEPVLASVSDFSNFTGGIYGRTLTGVSGSGTATLVLNFTGSPFAYDAAGNLTVASTTVSSSDRQPFTNGNISVSDGQTPKILTLNINLASNSYGTSLAGADDAVTLQFTVTKPIKQPKVSMDGKTVFVNGSGTGPFSAIINKSKNDPQGSVSYSMELTDNGGNTVTYSGSMSLSGGASSESPVQPQQPVTTVTSPAITQISEVVASSDGTAVYRFNSATAGTVNLSGDCATVSAYAVVGANSVTFRNLSPGVHNNCTMTVSDGNKTSNTLFIPGFTIGGQAAPAAAEPVVSANSGFKFTKFLKKGMSGDEVLELQKRLSAEGYLKATPNGYFGPATEAAVKAFQKAKGLDQLGYVGPGTRTALNGQ